MTITKTNIVLLIFFLSFTNCGKHRFCSDNELSIEKMDYNNNQLKIDGYYYKTDPDNIEENSTTINFFYKNGVSLKIDQYLDDIISEEIDVDQINSFEKSKAAWGTFQITDNLIKIEHWRKVLRGCLKTLYEEGEIINDSTYKITRREYRDEEKLDRVTTHNDVFHFRSLIEKPDSVNDYIP